MADTRVDILLDDPAVAFDSDARRNRHVATALERTYEALISEGFIVQLEQWDEAGGKGIDDLLAAGKTPQALEGEEAKGAIAEIAEAARKAQPTPEEEALDKARELLSSLPARAREDPGAQFEPEALEAISLIRKHDAPAWARCKQALKKAGTGCRTSRRP